MAFLTCQFPSASLGRDVTYQAIIPTNAPSDLPTLYLLHGLFDGYSTWHRRTSIERYAEERGIAVIMPDGGRSFYADAGDGENYFQYVSTELVAYTRALFPLSEDREKTFVAGNSMGGYGAVKCALTFPERFGACVTLSGALDIVSLVRGADWMQALSVKSWGENCKKDIEGSDSDLFALAERLCREPERARPRILQICGTEDFLYGENQTFRRYMENARFDFTYAEGPGSHDWCFWDQRIPEALDFLLKRPAP